MGTGFTARGGGTGAVCLVLVGFAGSLTGDGGPFVPFDGMTTSSGTGGVVLVLVKWINGCWRILWDSMLILCWGSSAGFRGRLTCFCQLLSEYPHLLLKF